MPNITSVTNPAPGQEANTYRSPITPGDTQVQNVPDPSRVGRADARTDRQDTAKTDIPRRYDSYFQAFMQALRNSGSVSSVLAPFLFAQRGTLVTSGMTAGISQELAQFLQMLPADAEIGDALYQFCHVVLLSGLSGPVWCGNRSVRP